MQLPPMIHPSAQPGSSPCQGSVWAGIAARALHTRRVRPKCTSWPRAPSQRAACEFMPHMHTLSSPNSLKLCCLHPAPLRAPHVLVVFNTIASSLLMLGVKPLQVITSSPRKLFAPGFPLPVSVVGPALTSPLPRARPAAGGGGQGWRIPLDQSTAAAWAGTASLPRCPRHAQGSCASQEAVLGMENTGFE